MFLRRPPPFVPPLSCYSHLIPSPLPPSDVVFTSSIPSTYFLFINFIHAQPNNSPSLLFKFSRSIYSYRSSRNFLTSFSLCLSHYGIFLCIFSVLFLLSFIAASQLHVPFLSQQSINSSPLILQELCGLYLPFYFLLVFLFLPFYLRPLIILRFHYCHFSFLLQIIF